MNSFKRQPTQQQNTHTGPNTPSLGGQGLKDVQQVNGFFPVLELYSTLY